MLSAACWRLEADGELSVHVSTDHAKLCKYLDSFEKAFIVHADNVGSKQFQDIRKVCAALGWRLSGCSSRMAQPVWQCSISAGAAGRS